MISVRAWHRRAARWIVVATLPAAAACSLFYPFDDITIGEGPRDGSASDALASDVSSSETGVPESGVPDRSSPGCPGERGSAMVRITVAGVADFCIDSTEVTRAQYQAFLDSSEQRIRPDAACTTNTSYLPAAPFPDLDSSLPVGKIDWCDAYAFCAWAGKRLCGAIGGGPLAPDATTDPDKGEWILACTKHGGRAYSYGGQSYVDGSCNSGFGDSGGAVLPVASLPTCQGGYDGVFDMIGNVYEWENSCDGVPGAEDAMCSDQGGSFRTSNGCKASGMTPHFWQFSGDWGIRCCADVKN